MSLELVVYKRNGIALVEEELKRLAALNSRAAKDEAKLRAALVAWAQSGFGGGILDFKPIEGSPYFKKLWEARYLKTARKNEDVHGYRIFYILTRRPTTGNEVAVLLKLWAKSGPDTPKAILTEAWDYALEVWQLIEQGRFFAPPAGKGVH